MLFHHLETVGSTNSYLMEMAERGAPEGAVVMADRQTSGRGRGDREWWSPTGNLYMSVLLRPVASPVELLRLPVIASLAFLSAMGGSGTSLRVKWPNDILLDGKKVAGILVESRSDGDKIQWAVVGFGVNMSRTGQEIPEELEGRIAFLDDFASSESREDLARRIVQQLLKGSGFLKGEGWKKAMEEWSSRALWGGPYAFNEGQRVTRGFPVRLDASGGLVMRTENGEVTVYSGEIEPV